MRLFSATDTPSRTGVRKPTLFNWDTASASGGQDPRRSLFSREQEGNPRGEGEPQFYEGNPRGEGEPQFYERVRKARKTLEPQITKFAGNEKGGIQAFMKQFISVINRNEIDRELLSALFPQFLTGKALKKFNSLPERDQRDYKVAYKQLAKSLSKIRDPISGLLALQQVQQRMDEEVGDYLERFEKAIDEAGLEEEEQERVRMAYFVKGLKNDIREHMIFSGKGFDTLQEVVTEAERLETALLAIRNTQKSEPIVDELNYLGDRLRSLETNVSMTLNNEQDHYEDHYENGDHIGYDEDEEENGYNHEGWYDANAQYDDNEYLPENESQWEDRGNMEDYDDQFNGNNQETRGTGSFGNIVNALNTAFFIVLALSVIPTVYAEKEVLYQLSDTLNEAQYWHQLFENRPATHDCELQKMFISVRITLRTGPNDPTNELEAIVLLCGSRNTHELQLAKEGQTVWLTNKTHSFLNKERKWIELQSLTEQGHKLDWGEDSPEDSEKAIRKASTEYMCEEIGERQQASQMDDLDLNSDDDDDDDTLTQFNDQEED